MTPQGSLQGRRQVLALWTRRGERAMHASPHHTMASEGPSDVVLDVHHANILCGEVRIERDSEVFQARPHHVLVYAHVT